MLRRNFLAAVSSSIVPSAASAWKADRDKSLGSVAEEVAVSEVVIVYNSADPAEAAAARELRDFITRMSGIPPRLAADSLEENTTPLPVRFLVGRTRATRELISSGKLV